MLDSRLFLKLLQLDLRAHPPAAPVVKVTLAAEPVEPRAGQGGLFLPTTPAPDRLELTLARLAGIVGEQKMGAAEVLDTHRSDAFQMKRFAPSAPQGLKRDLKELRIAETHLGDCHSECSKESAFLPTMALRRFRPPLAASVELQDGEPVRITAGEITGEVASLSGPWRSSGDWWKGDESNTVEWAREEWDIAVAAKEGIALYRIYRDVKSEQWFLEGSYD